MKLKVKSKSYGLWLLCCSMWLLLSFPIWDWEQAQGSSAFMVTAEKLKENLRQSIGAKNSLPNPSRRVDKTATSGGKFFCPDQTIETLTNKLLHDLPGYANRSIQRARPPLLSGKPDFYSYVLVAGRPEFTPLPLTPGKYGSDVPNSESAGVEQVFFTTLERMYTGGKAIDLQQFHWLFLTKTSTGWRMVMMFSQIGYYPANKPPTPPKDTTNGDIGQAINVWLRDCRKQHSAGS
jgi:hypothetical protein